MTEKYAWYQVPGIWEYSKERKVRLSCFRLYLDSYLVPGTRYETISIFVCFLCLLPTGEAVPLHTSTYAYTRTYIVHIQQCGTRWSGARYMWIGIETEKNGMPRTAQQLTTHRRTMKSINKERHPTLPWYVHVYIVARVGASAVDPFFCCWEKGEEEH